MKKINDKRGFTLIEMLACTVTLMLVGMICTTGIKLAMKSYEESVLESNVQSLESTLELYIGDILRYADPASVETIEVSDEAGNTLSQVSAFTNSNYQMYSGMIKTNSNGYLVCTSIHNNGKETLLVGKNAYGDILSINNFFIYYDKITGVFTVKYEISNTLNATRRPCEFSYRTIAQ